MAENRIHFFQKVEHAFQYETLCIKYITMNFFLRIFRKSKVFDSFQRDSEGYFLSKSYILQKGKTRIIYFFLNEAF